MQCGLSGISGLSSLSWYSLQPRSRCLTLWTLSEHWHCVESYGGRRVRKGLKYSCPSRSWWIAEAAVWSVLVMSFVGFQLGPKPLCLCAMLQYPCPLAVVVRVHICCHSLRLTSSICRLIRREMWGSQSSGLGLPHLCTSVCSLIFSNLCVSWYPLNVDLSGANSGSRPHLRFN